MGLGDEPVRRRAEQFLKLWPHAEVPEVSEDRQAPDEGESFLSKRARHLGKVEAGPVLVHVFVNKIPGVLLQQSVDVGGRAGVVLEVFRLLFPHEDEIRHRVLDPLGTVSLTQRSILPQHAADRLQMRPAGHGVVAHQQQAARSEPLAGQREDLFSHARRHPAIDTVQRQKIERSQVGGHMAEIGRDDPCIAKLPRSDVAGHGRGVLRIQIHTHKLASGVGGGERGKAAAQPAAEFEEAEALGHPRRHDAVERGDIPHRHWRHLRIEPWNVRDVGDVAGSCHERSSSDEGVCGIRLKPAIALIFRRSG